MSLKPGEINAPIIWSIAGSDSCGGAGIQADLKTLAALGAHGCTIIASVTAQNSVGVRAVNPVSAGMLTAQIAALREDMPPACIKLGLLGDADGIAELAGRLAEIGTYTIYDPVIVSSSGTRLLSSEACEAVKTNLLPHIHLLTPNVSETEYLTGTPIAHAEDVERAANALRAMGTRAVIIKGWCEGDTAQDYYSNGAETFWLTSPKRDGQTARGTGCTFSSALAAAHALGYSEADAAVIAKAYVTMSLRNARAIGRGMPILSHLPWPCAAEDFPWRTSVSESERAAAFPDCGDQPLGFYPVVDSVEWLKRLLPLGVRTAQLRIKEKSGAALADEIRSGIVLARQHDCRLFINDHWQLAITHKAYGVHLGQEDLESADITAIRAAGLRLGISTHCYREVARAHALRPSYIAIGPIFPTTLKAMNFAPQGVAAFRQWRCMLNYPLVAIGGITLESAPALRAAGADGIAVVSDITQNPDAETRARAWLETWR